MGNDVENIIGRQFLTLDEVADILQTDISDVKHLIDAGELQALQLGSTAKWRVEVSVLDQFIEHEYEQARRHAMWNNPQIASAQNVYEL